jgi:hypothetical protein
MRRREQTSKDDGTIIRRNYAVKTKNIVRLQRRGGSREGNGVTDAAIETTMMISYLLILLVCKTSCGEIRVGPPYPSYLQCQQEGEKHHEAVSYKCVSQRRIER